MASVGTHLTVGGWDRARLPPWVDGSARTVPPAPGPRPHTHAGCVHCRSALCTPTPQLREHRDQALQPDQPPSTASGRKPTGTHSPFRHHCGDTRRCGSHPGPPGVLSLLTAVAGRAGEAQGAAAAGRGAPFPPGCADSAPRTPGSQVPGARPPRVSILQVGPAAGSRHPTCTAGRTPPYLALPTPGAVHGRIQLGVTGGPHGAPERVADVLQEEGAGHTSPPPGATTALPPCSPGRGRHAGALQLGHAGAPPVPGGPGRVGACDGCAPTGPVPAGATHVHAVTEGGVGPVLQATLVAHIVQDSGRHGREVDDVLGGSVIQAHAPAAAADGTERGDGRGDSLRDVSRWWEGAQGSDCRTSAASRPRPLP